MTRKTRWMLIEAVVVLAILIALLVYRFPQFLEAQNINTPENFPDPVFRLCAEFFMDVNPEDKFTATEAEQKRGRLVVDESLGNIIISPVLLGMPPKHVNSLLGIRYFKSLDELRLDHVTIDSIDLSLYKNLTNLSLSSCNFKTLDLSHNSKLKELRLSEIPIDILDLRFNQKLEIIDLDIMVLKKLILPESAELREIACHHTQLASLDISQNPNLWRLDLSDNLFENPIDISHNPKLKALVLENNRYDCADLPALQELAKHFPEDTYHMNQKLTRGFLYLKQGDLNLSDCGK